MDGASRIDSSPAVSSLQFPGLCAFFSAALRCLGLVHTLRFCRSELSPGVHNTLWVFFRKVVIQNNRDTVTFHTTSVINLGPLIEFGAEEERRMNYLDLLTWA